MTSTVLVIGGTGEAHALAAELHTRRPVRVVSCLAGAVARPRLPPGEVRIGGFGGVEGLAAWLVEHRPAAVVDASHPFAARISAACVAACPQVGVPLLRLERPPWTPGPGDDWHEVDDVPTAAVEAARLGHRLLVTTGRRGLAPFAALAGCSVLARCVDPPTEPLHERVEVLLDRGPYTLEGEAALLSERGIEVVVTKNSGGPMVAAKLQAARSLGLPVVMVRRPPPAGAPSVATVQAALVWVVERCASMSVPASDRQGS